MRFRTEATGGYNLDGLIQLALLLLTISVGGLIVIGIAIYRYLAGRSYLALLLGGLVAAMPLVVGAMLFLS